MTKRLRRLVRPSKIGIRVFWIWVRFFHCSRKCMLLGSGWEGQRRASNDQLIFWPLNFHFDHSTRVLTVQLAFQPFNIFGLFNLHINSISNISGFALTFWLRLWHFGSCLEVLYCALMFQLSLWCCNSFFDVSTWALTFWLALFLAF